MFINPAEELLLVNTAIQDLYDLLLSLGGESLFSVETNGISTVAGASTVALPSDFYLLVSLHIRWASNRHEELHELTADGDRYRYADHSTWSEGSPKVFKLQTSQLELFPTPTDVRVLPMRYVPVAPVLAGLAGETKTVNGWHKLCALQIAAEFRMIRGQPNNMLMQQFGQMRERLETIAAERAINEPARVRDVMPELTRSESWWFP